MGFGHCLFVQTSLGFRVWAALGVHLGVLLPRCFTRGCLPTPQSLRLKARSRSKMRPGLRKETPTLSLVFRTKKCQLSSPAIFTWWRFLLFHFCGVSLLVQQITQIYLKKKSVPRQNSCLVRKECLSSWAVLGPEEQRPPLLKRLKHS